MFVQRQIVSQKVSYRDKNGGDLGTQEVTVMSLWETVEVKLVSVESAQVVSLQNEVKAADVLPALRKFPEPKSGKRRVFTPEDVQAVQAHFRAGESRAEIAEKCNLQYGDIHRHTKDKDLMRQNKAVKKVSKNKTYYALPKVKVSEGEVITV